jgi:hypothetical protein
MLAADAIREDVDWRLAEMPWFAEITRRHTCGIRWA